MPAPPDTTLPPRYRAPSLLAHGGMADVYRATDDELGREVAVKVLAPRFAADESLRRRFQREALAAARLSGNPHIVTIFDVGESDGRPLIVMELLPGGSLDERVDGRACDPPQVLEWLEQAGAALDAAHAAGIVHRDVKPGNLLLDERGQVKVADFGIASAAGLDSFTQTGTILGTAGYLSPEQARGERATAASDRYALAVVGWELLTGRRPFASETVTAEATAHAHAPVPSITRAGGSLPADLDPIFARALAKDPGERYPSAGAFVSDLRRAFDGADDTWAAPATLVVAPSSQRRRLWLPLAGALLLAAGVAAGVLAFRGGGGDRTTPPAASPRTVVRTVTEPGTTVERTVTAEATTVPPTTTAPAVTTSSASGAALNNAGFAKMRAGDYAGARPLLEQAVAKLQGSGSLDEAYADYNLAFTRFALGDCTDVLALLDNSERIQGHRPEIEHLRHDARKSCSKDR